MLTGGVFGLEARALQGVGWGRLEAEVPSDSKLQPGHSKCVGISLKPHFSRPLPPLLQRAPPGGTWVRCFQLDWPLFMATGIRRRRLD